MFKCLVFITCVCSLTMVFCEPGHENIREKQSTWRSELSDLSRTAVRRKRQNNNKPFDIELIKGLELTELQNKESFMISPLNDRSTEDQQLKAKINTILASLDLSKYKENCNNGNCEVDRNAVFQSLEDRAVKNAEYYDYMNNYNDRDQYSQYSRPPPPPPPPPPDHGRLPPPPPFHDHYGRPPPPPPHHGGPPPPPPPHHNHHGAPPPPPNYDYSSYYDQYDPSSRSYYGAYRRSYDDRQTRQSSYYDNQRAPLPPYYQGGPPGHRGPPPPPHNHAGPPSPPHHGGPPPPPHHGGPPPPPHHGGLPPPPHHGGPPPPPRHGGPPSPPHHEGLPPQPYHRDSPNQPHHEGPQNYKRPPAQGQTWDIEQVENRPLRPHFEIERDPNLNSKPDRLVDATQNTTPVKSPHLSTAEAQSTDEQYELDVRFADDAQTTNNPTKNIEETSLPPYFFQAVPVTPAHD